MSLSCRTKLYRPKEITTMPKIIVTIEGEPQEIREALQELFNLVPFPADLPVEDAALSPEWTADEVAQLWFAIKEGARGVLHQIARHGGECHHETLQNSLKVENGFQIAGRMSSYGFALKRLGLTHKQPLYRYDYGTNIYHMKPEITDLIVDLSKGYTGSASHPYPKGNFSDTADQAEGQ